MFRFAALAVALLLAVAPLRAEPLPKPGTVFQDCDDCPMMVVIPPGAFLMGSPPTEKGRSANEGPQHRVTIAYRFAVGRHEVTFAEWDTCVAARACPARPRDAGGGRGTMPVLFVSWHDGHTFADWLTRKTGKPYRLLSEAEWEYAARAGTTTPYWWGKTASHEYANYGTDKCCGGAVVGRDQWEMSSPVESFPANPFGVFDILGNVWEWVEDCWEETYDHAPADGSPTKTGDCQRRVMRGGAWSSMPVKLRVAYHDAYPPDDTGEFIGFRIARGE